MTDPIAFEAAFSTVQTSFPTAGDGPAFDTDATTVRLPGPVLLSPEPSTRNAGPGVSAVGTM